MREYVRRLLADRYEVEAVADGAAALAAARAREPRPGGDRRDDAHARRLRPDSRAARRSRPARGAGDCAVGARRRGGAHRGARRRRRRLPGQAVQRPRAPGARGSAAAIGADPPRGRGGAALERGALPQGPRADAGRGLYLRGPLRGDQLLQRARRRAVGAPAGRRRYRPALLRLPSALAARRHGAAARPDADGARDAREPRVPQPRGRDRAARWQPGHGAG